VDWTFVNVRASVVDLQLEVDRASAVDLIMEVDRASAVDLIMEVDRASAVDLIEEVDRASAVDLIVEVDQAWAEGQPLIAGLASIVGLAFDFVSKTNIRRKFVTNLKICIRFYTYR